LGCPDVNHEPHGAMDYTVTRPFRGVSASDRRIDRRRRLVEAAYKLVGRDGAARLGVGDVCAAAGLTKRYFYENFASLDELGASVVSRAIDVMVERVEPFRPGAEGGSVYAGLNAFIAALLDDRCLARVLITETQAGPLSPFRTRIVEAGVATLLPVDQLADTASLDHRRFIAYAQMGALSELCWAWHEGKVVMERDELVDRLVGLFGRIADQSSP
jgi:AcrR family transcriptional regulator